MKNYSIVSSHRRSLSFSLAGLLALSMGFVDAQDIDGTKVRNTTFFNEPPDPTNLADILFPETKQSENRSGTFQTIKKVGSQSRAQSVVRNTTFFDTPPDPIELADLLFPPVTRSIVIAGSSNTVPVEDSAAMPIYFHFGKTTFTRESREYLDSVGKMMQMQRLADKTVLIEGHTDAVGTRTSNQRLSELRALAVKRFLVSNYGIDPLQLFPEGRGETKHVAGSDPRASENRRVEFLPYPARNSGG